MIPISKLSCVISLIALSAGMNRAVLADIGVGAKPISGAEMLLDGSRETLDQKWIYWQGPGFKSSMPIKWKMRVANLVPPISSLRNNIEIFGCTSNSM